MVTSTRVEDDLKALSRAAQKARPAVRADEGELNAHLEALRAEGGAFPEHVADVFLAFAAARGDKAAVKALEEEVLSAAEPAIRKVDSAPSFVGEVRQRLRIRLLVGEDGHPPRLLLYQGRGPLAGFVRIAATRIALNLKRDEAAPVATDDLFADLASQEPDPELRHLKTLYRSEMTRALSFALARLEPRERAVLRLHHADGLPLSRIAVLYKVHESTVSRWVKAAAEQVAATAKKRLIEQLALSSSQVDSVARMLQSQLDLSIERLLRSDPAGEKEQ